MSSTFRLFFDRDIFTSQYGGIDSISQSFIELLILSLLFYQLIYVQNSLTTHQLFHIFFGGLAQIFNFSLSLVIPLLPTLSTERIYHTTYYSIFLFLSLLICCIYYSDMTPDFILICMTSLFRQYYVIKLPKRDVF